MFIIRLVKLYRFGSFYSPLVFENKLELFFDKCYTINQVIESYFKSNNISRIMSPNFILPVKLLPIRPFLTFLCNKTYPCIK